MSRRSQTPPIPGLTLFFALLGLVWCAFISFPTANPAPCATSGCELFRDSKFAGLSLWWVGGAFFFLLTIVCLRGNRAMARALLKLAIFLDSILLIIMFVTAPCFDCLVVAAFMGLCLFCLRPQPGSWHPEDNKASVLLPIWFGLFLANCVLAANEQVPPYVMGNTESSEVRLYFSPSCPACREALMTLGDTAALYPVEEREGDFEAIVRLENLLQNTDLSYEEVLEQSLDPNAPMPEVSLFRKTVLGIQLLRNKAAVLGQGFRALPLIQINGMPGFQNPQAIPEIPLNQREARPAPQSPPAQNNGFTPYSGSGLPDNGQDPAYDRDHGTLPPSGSRSRPGYGTDGEAIPDFLRNADNLGQCGGSSQVPCD